MKNNEEEWEELNNWYEEDKRKKQEKYGIDFETINVNKKKNNKEIDRVVKILEKMGKGICIFFIIVLIVLMKQVGSFLSVVIQMSNNNPKSVEKMYNIKIKLVSKETNENKDGKYVFKLKKNKKLQFNVYRERGNLYDDYYASCQKYYFNKWNDEDKKKFEVKEEYDDKGLLDYKLYVRFNGIDDIEPTIYMIYKFVEFVGTDFTYAWKIYFYEDNFIGDFCSNVAGNATHSKEEKEYNVICSKETYLKHLRSQELDTK